MDLGGILEADIRRIQTATKEKQTQTAFCKSMIGLALTAIAAFAQAKPKFEVATIKPAAPFNLAQIQAAVKAGAKLPFGPNVDSRRAEFTLMDLQSLIALAYAVRPDQIKGPDWMSTTKFDIIAKLPDGAAKEDAPKMLQSLLEERFSLTLHRASVEHPVLALLAGKGALKMKPSALAPVAADIIAAGSEPPKPGETSMTIGDGATMRMSAATGAMTIDMGLKGKVSFGLNLATHSVRMDFTMVTMAGLAEALTNRLSETDEIQVVDMTDIKGNYDASVEEAPRDAAPADMTAGDPGGGMTARLAKDMQALGLKLEPRKARVEQLIIDHVEKTPTGN